MIGSFKDREAETIFVRTRSKRYGTLSRVILRKFLQLDAATTLDTLKVPPGNQREALRGDRKGQHSIRVNQQLRICFTWRDGYAFDIELVDYR